MATRLIALATALAALATFAGQPQAHAADLTGTWSGGGFITFASGDRERARCRAHFARVSSRTFDVNAVCSTTGFRVEQSARVRQVGGQVYVGRFTNSEYNVSGDIRVTVKGRSQSVSLSSGESRATFQLYRR